jgi:hypothetical protein
MRPLPWPFDSGASPTATTSPLLLAVTPERELESPVVTFGLGMTLQLVPFQFSVRPHDPGGAVRDPPSRGLRPWPPTQAPMGLSQFTERG